MTKARRSTASRRDKSHRRRRTMAFESLDVRTVLSAGSIVAAPWMPPMDQFDGRDAQRDLISRDAGRPISYGATNDFGAGDFGAATRLGPGADRFGSPLAFDNRGPAPRGSFGPPPSDYHAPLIVSSSGPSGGSTVLLLPPGGWDSMSPRDVVATLLLIDLLGQPTSAPPLPGSSPVSHSAKEPPPSNLGSSLPQSWLGSSGNGTPTSSPERLSGPSQSNGLSSLAATSTSDGDALSSSVQNVSASKSAQAFLLPGFTSQDDASTSERFGDGGWIELTPRDAQLPHWRSPRVDEKLSTPTRRLREFAADEFWDDVLEGLEDLLDDAEDEAPATNQRKPSRSARNDLQRVEPIESPITYPAARYDEGGMIALDASGSDAVTAAPATADAAPNVDAAPITFEAGVALFQVFERSEPSAEVAPAAESAEEVLPEGDAAEKPADLRAEPVEQVAAGAGLGLLFSGPILRGRRADERRIRLRKAR